MEGNELIQEEVAGLITPEVIRPEVNFLLLPFFALSWKEINKLTKIEYQISVKRGDAEAHLSWKVLPSIEYGIPTPFDKELKGVVDVIIERTKKPISNPFELPYISEMARMMGLKPNKNGKYDGHTYSKIKEAFKRMTLTGVESKGTFYAKGKRVWVDDTFHLYERVIFRGEKMSCPFDHKPASGVGELRTFGIGCQTDKKMPYGAVAEKNYLWLSSLYLDSINDNYVKPIDYTYFQSLKNCIAKRLYELLGIKFYGLRNKREKFFRIGYLNLYRLLPITPQKHLSKAKENLNPAHNELIQTGFLAKVEYEITKDRNSFNLLYFPGERARREIKGDWGIKIPDEERPLEIEAPGEITRMSCPFDNHSESYVKRTKRREDVSQQLPLQPDDSELRLASHLSVSSPTPEAGLWGELSRRRTGLPCKLVNSELQDVENPDEIGEEEERSPIAQALINRGITKAVAVDFAENFPAEYLAEKIALHDYNKEIGELTANAAGWLREAIVRDYKLSDEQLKKRAKSRLVGTRQEEQRTLEEKAREIQEQRLTEALKDFPEEEQWVRERVVEHIKVREMTIKAIGGEPFTEEEIEQMSLNYKARIPKTLEEKRGWLISNYKEYALSTIIAELREEQQKTPKEDTENHSERFPLNSIEDVLGEVARQKAEFEVEQKRKDCRLVLTKNSEWVSKQDKD